MNDAEGSGRSALPLRGTRASRRRTRARPPGFTSSAARSSSRCWSPTTRSSRSGVSRQRPSGLRRHVPLPEQGASTSTRSAASAPLREFFELARRIEQPVSMVAPARAARGASFDRRRRLLSVASIVAPGAAAASASDLPPAPAQRSRMRSPAVGFAGERNQLAALVLHLDEAACERRMIIDPAVRRQSNAPGAEWRGSAPANSASISSRATRATLTRRSSGARSSNASHSCSPTSGDSSAMQPLGNGAWRSRRLFAVGSASGPRGSPNSSSSAGSSCARPRIAARPLSGRSAVGGSPGRRVRAQRGDPSSRRSGAA